MKGLVDWWTMRRVAERAWLHGFMAAYRPITRYGHPESLHGAALAAVDDDGRPRLPAWLVSRVERRRDDV
jgi:hypothetical protein